MSANIGSFEIIREIGKSELGTVYKAYDPQKKATVALRLLPADAPEALECSRQYLLRAKAASVLDSPNITSIYGGIEEQGMLYVAMEYVEGVPLDATMATQQGFSASELLDISRQVCRGLDHAHSKGIFHRRLTPSGIVTEWDGTVKITDFAADPGPLEGKSSNELRYMSPEQVQGRAPDARSNVFNWGAILYELATGKPAFRDTDADGVLREVLEVMPTAPSQVNAKVPVGISRIIMKALAKNPEYRFQHAGDLVSELEAECAAASRPTVPGVPQINTPLPDIEVPSEQTLPSAPPREELLGYAVPPAPVPAAPAVPKPATALPKKPQAVVTLAVQPPVAPTSAPVSLTPQQIKILVGVIGAALVLMVTVMIADNVRGRRLRAEAEAAAAAPLVGTTVPENFTVPPAPVPEPEAQPAIQMVPSARAPKTRRKAAIATVAVTSGGLVVNSAPEGALVQVDGNAAGLTPVSLANVAPGQHTVVLSKTGYATESRGVLVQSGTRAALAVSLNQLAAAMAAIASDPPGASIIIDGHDSGKLTPAKVIVEKGMHSFVLRKAGYMETSASMAVNPGETFQFAPTLRPLGNADEIKQVGKFKKLIGRGGQENSARVLVRTFPKGAQIMFNSRMMDHTSPAEFLLGPGTYEVTLSLTGYKTVHKKITVESNGRMEVNETFER